MKSMIGVKKTRCMNRRLSRQQEDSSGLVFKTKQDSRMLDFTITQYGVHFNK